jgi:hypothetical protein
MGCASFYCSRYPNNNYPPTVAENIPIYNNYPPTPYEIIGEVGGDGAPASSWGGIGKKMREYAAGIGGDAIVIQSQATPYIGSINTPTTISTTSSTYGSANTAITGSAQIVGNNIYGQASGQTYGRVYGQSETVIHPGSSTPMFGKSVRAFVIKFNSGLSQGRDFETIPTDGSVGSHCKSGSDCKSGHCGWAACTDGSNGSPCYVSSDCQSNFCSEGRCIDGSKGQSCLSPAGCKSGICNDALCW